ncbi:hypothetical protein RugamoR1_49970 [Rugamonas sp. R1(2021)]
MFGNSITRHAPMKALGWFGDWGMAATTAEDDFVSQLAQLLTERSKGVKWKADALSGSTLEKSPADYVLPATVQQLAQKADIVVVELGDNYNPAAPGAEAFADGYTRTLKGLRPSNGKLLCVSTWWTSKPKDSIIAASCKAAGGTFVDISGLQAIRSNVAGNQRTIADKGVAAHPSDKGMRAIAERIAQAIPN